MHCLGSFPNWDSTAVYKGLPSNVQKSGCRLSAQFGNVYAPAAIYCFYLFTFNDYILKWSQIILYKKLKLFQFSSVVQSCLTLCNPMVCSTLGFPVHHQLPDLLKLMSIESLMPPNNFILCRPLLLLPSIVLSIRVFSNELVLRIRWPKYWSFSFSISPSNE